MNNMDNREPTDRHGNRVVVDRAAMLGLSKEKPVRRSTLQDWVMELPLMQQAVLISAIRAPDGMDKFHKAKKLLKFYRRCILVSAFDGRPINNPWEPGGGSFTGPSIQARRVNNGPIEPIEDWSVCAEMRQVVDDFIDSRDSIPYHAFTHLLHGFQIVGVHHPEDRVLIFWDLVYRRMVNALHLKPESSFEMNKRLSDNIENWKAREDPSSCCSD